MVRVQRNFRAQDFHGASKPEPAPKDEPKVEATQTPAPAPVETAPQEPKKAPVKRAPKSTKPKAEVDPHVNDATEHKE